MKSKTNLKIDKRILYELDINKTLNKNIEYQTNFIGNRSKDIIKIKDNYDFMISDNIKHPSHLELLTKMNNIEYDFKFICHGYFTKNGCYGNYKLLDNYKYNKNIFYKCIKCKYILCEFCVRNKNNLI